MSDTEFGYEPPMDNPADLDNDIFALNPNNADDMNQYHRLMIQGKCVKLPNTESIDDELYQNFLTGFMSDIKDDEHERSKVFRYLWKNEDENIAADKIPYGVPGDMDDLIQMIKGRSFFDVHSH